MESMSLTELMRNALVLARSVDMDVFNALNIMENEQVCLVVHHSICVCVLCAWGCSVWTTTLMMVVLLFFCLLLLLLLSQFLEPLLFRRGDGKLQYYMYNWRMSKEFNPQASKSRKKK